MINYDIETKILLIALSYLNIKKHAWTTIIYMLCVTQEFMFW